MRSSRADARVPTGREPFAGRTSARLPLTFVLAIAGLAAGTAPAAAAPPAISGVGPAEMSDTQSVLGGTIAPGGLRTTYRFEYGTDSGYGSATTVDAVGPDEARVPVSKGVGGLQPSTTYHFRLVATNADGTVASPDQSFTTDANPPLPSGRAYEMVSPLDKNGGSVNRDTLGEREGQSGTSPSGEAVAFASSTQFGDTESGSLFSTYVARRGATGWTTRGVSPPIGNVSAGPEFLYVFGLSLDLSTVYYRAAPPLTPEAEWLNRSWGLYARRVEGEPRYTLLSSPWQPLLADNANFRDRFDFAADTPDGRHVVFTASRALLPPPAPPDNSTIIPNAVYEWVDGTVRLASVLPDGFTLDSAGVAAGSRQRPSTGFYPGDHLLSDDGRRLFFTAHVLRGDGTSALHQLFVREGGTTTRLVSASERPGEGPAVTEARPEFWGAKASDGSVAFFSAGAPLTPGAGERSLYRWDADAPEGDRLTELTSDPLGQAGVLGPAAISDDATAVYFVATGVLAENATRDEPNLYVWREGQGVQHVATLTGPPTDASIDAGAWVPTYRAGGRAARVSADGERLLFASYARLDSDHDITEATPQACGNPGAGGENCRQIYVYDAPTDALKCITCVPGAEVTGDANLFGNGDARNQRLRVPSPSRPSRNLTADGSLAFFETNRRLLTADTNNTSDVYEWADPDRDGHGNLRLVSPGRRDADAFFLDASAAGDDVFFTTREGLVGVDTDDLVDVYDARVGGGFAHQNPSPSPPCGGEECQGAFSTAPILPGIGSAGASHGDARPGPRAAFSVARLTRRQRARLARGMPVVLRVRVNRSGKVALVARARLGKRTRVVDRAAALARRPGTVRLKLRLSGRARRVLTRQPRPRLNLAVRFTGVREAKTSVVRLPGRDSSTGRGAR